MDLIPDTLKKSDNEVRKTESVYIIVGVVILVIVAVSAIVYYEAGSGTRSAGEVTSGVPIVQQATTTNTVTAADKEKLINQMNQLTTATGTTAQKSSPLGVPPEPVATPAEKAKLFNAMQQKN